jgi:hypothetical protein
MHSQIVKTLIYFVTYNSLSLIFLYLIRIIHVNTDNLVTQIVVSSLIPGIILFTHSVIRYRKNPQPNQNYKYLSGFLVAFILLSWTVINIERSRSFQVIRSVHVNKILGQSKLNQLPILVSDQEERNYRAFVDRIREQINDGNIKCEEEKIYLSTVGNLIQVVSAEFAKQYKLGGYFEIDQEHDKTPSIEIKINCGYFE